MPSRREQILAKIASVLSGNQQIGVYRSRVEALSRDDLPAIVIRPDTETIDNTSLGIAVRLLEIELMVHARGEIPDQAADSIVAWMHATLMADQTLGGLCGRVIERETKYEFVDADYPAVQISVKYEIKYHTKANDLSNI